MELRMDGRKALITGASLGLGRAMAERFAGAGAEVAIVARRSELLDAASASLLQALVPQGPSSQHSLSPCLSLLP